MEDNKTPDQTSPAEVTIPRQEMSSTPSSPSDEALVEWGKTAIKKAASHSREFHKTMLTTVATFIALFVTAYSIISFGKVGELSDRTSRLYLSFPIFLLLISSIVFAFGYYQPLIHLNLRDITILRETRRRRLIIRAILAIVGTALFISAISLLMIEIMILSLK